MENSLAHAYRKLQHWNQWLSQEFLGNHLLKSEAATLTKITSRHLGKQALIIGVPQQLSLLNSSKIPCHTVVTPIFFKADTHNYIEGDFYELPILTGSIDLVVLPHTLELVDNPRKVLSEACRIVKPEGLIAVFGFNPYSLWGLCKLFRSKKTIPWNANFLPSYKIRNWLELADFQMEQQKTILFRPPVNNPKVFRSLHFMEIMGKTFFPFCSSVYVSLARAKVIPLTPIKLKWKQQLSKISISTTISGHIAR